jgi:hypothetical protein
MVMNGIVSCAEARRALVGAGAEAAVRALLAAGPAGPQPADLDEPPLIMVAGSGRGLHAPTWRDVEEIASKVLGKMRQPPPPAAAPPAAAAADAPQCVACGKRAAAAPGGRPLMRCGGCRGPERWCSTECQRESWLGGHREVCRQRRQAAAAAAAAAAAGT